MEDEDSMDGLEAAETENTVETGKGTCSSNAFINFGNMGCFPSIYPYVRKNRYRKCK